MVAMMSVFVAACGSDDDGNGTPNVPTQPETPTLSVPVKSYNVAQSGETLKVTLSTNQTGVSVDVAADSKSWIHPSAINTQSFSLTVDKSDEYDTRTGSVKVKAGTLSETITIIQQGGKVLTLAQTEYTISDVGGTILIDTESNFKYDVSINVDWIKEVSNTSRAISKSTITLDVEPNESYDSRQAIIVFRDPSNQMSKSVTIVQAQKNAIVLSKDSYDFGMDGGEIVVDVASNIEYETKIDCSWITQKSTRALTSRQLTFSVSAMSQTQERTATISFESKETGVVQRIAIKQAVQDINGHEYVDLGLPSGTLWATCNIGASSPDGYGDYYSWGETKNKSSYDSSTSTASGRSTSDLKSSGVIDANFNLTKNYDVAAKNWGGSWRMPTIDEIEELLHNCSWSRESVNGVLGHRVKSMRNGKSIFLPFVGWISGNKVNSKEYGFYWSSTSAPDDSYQAYNLQFYDYGHSNSYRESRSKGCCVRAVSTGFGGDLSTSNKINGHAYVDLGLPSGTKWATCNVGAMKQDESGYGYAWGETEWKSAYVWENYLTGFSGPNGVLRPSPDCGTSKDPLSGYFTPNTKSIAGTKYDVAHVKWGGSWQMPTKEQFEELINPLYCSWGWSWDGLIITSKKNRNYIYLPADGMHNASYHDMNKTLGLYWSATPDPDYKGCAYLLEFSSKYCEVIYNSKEEYPYYRVLGLNVRPVSK